MVYKYKQKTNQGGTWTEDTMRIAMQEAKTQSINSVAKKYGIPFATLYRHLKSGKPEKKLGRYRTVFTNAQEEELYSYIKDMDSVFYGLSRDEFKTLAFTYAEQNKVPHPFKNGQAGDEWLLGFQARHADIVLRAPEPTSIARARGFNRPQVERFYNVLSDALDTHAFPPTRIYNMDETGIHTTTNKPPKILSVCGKRQVGVIASAERGVLTTAICCCNAAGSYIPPYLIFARKKMNDRLLDGAPPGTVGSCSDNGWINGEVFLQWLTFFINEVRPSEQNKVLLLLDNHESHKYYPALEYASQNHVIFISFAPHTTHKMQPLDKAVYGPLKKYFEAAINSFQKRHVGRIINQYDIARLFAEAYLKAATCENAVSGFRSPGIWPFNRYVFSDCDYAPASVTDRPLPLAEDPNSNVNGEGQCQEPTSLTAEGQNSEDQSPTPASSKNQKSTFPKKSSSESLPSTSVSEKSPQQAKSSKEHNSESLPSTSASGTNSLIHVSPMEIRPLPQMSNQPTNRKRKTQKAEVLTSTPIKRIQKSKLAKKSVKQKATKKIKMESKSKKKLFPAPKTVKAKYSCSVCEDPYVEPPTEDWIQCNQCQRWNHELCTSYTGFGSYYCDECDD